jgi:3-phenylpropionate/trans-cinnamate dioxygenase ferredoxin subunit
MSKWIYFARINEIQPGGHKAITINGTPIVLFNLEGDYYALENRCTHEDFPLSEGCIIDGQITCPLHGAKFNIKTGAVTAPPAFMDVTTFAVRIEEDIIQVEIPN